MSTGARSLRDSSSREMHTNSPFQRSEIYFLVPFKIMEAVSHMVFDFSSSTLCASRQYSVERSTFHLLSASPSALFLLFSSLPCILKEIYNLCLYFFISHELSPTLSFNLLHIAFYNHIFSYQVIVKFRGLSSVLNQLGLFLSWVWRF